MSIQIKTKIEIEVAAQHAAILKEIFEKLNNELSIDDWKALFNISKNNSLKSIALSQLRKFGK